MNNLKTEFSASAGNAGLSRRDKNETAFKEMLSLALEAMMDSSSDLLFVKDMNFKYICCSRAFARMVGLQSERDVTGKTDYDLFDQTTADKYRSDDLKLLANGTSLVEFVEEIPSPNAAPSYSCTSKYLLRDASGSVIGLFGTGRDITERREADLRLKLLTDSIPGGLATYACTLEKIKLIYFNDGFCKMHGCNREEYEKITAQDPVSMVYKEDLPALTDQFYSLMRDDISMLDCTFRIRRKDGCLVWTSLRGTPFEQRGNTIFINAVIYDVTKQKKIEEQLQLNAQGYARLLFDATAEKYDHIFKINLSTGEASLVNFIRGVPVEQRIKENWDDYFLQLFETIHKDDQSQFAAKTFNGNLSRIPEGKTVSLTYRRRIGVGSYRWYTTTLHQESSPDSCSCQTNSSAAALPRIVTAFTKDINDEMVERMQLKDTSEHDPLTDLFNRTKFESMKEQEYLTLSSCGILFFDLNNLKEINDTQGHKAGDDQLCQTADSIRSITSRRIHGYRYGGDEFFAVVCNAAEEEMDQLIFMWLARLEELSKNSGIRCSVAVGKAWSSAPFSIESLLSTADKDMYRNKLWMKRNALQKNQDMPRQD